MQGAVGEANRQKTTFRQSKLVQQRLGGWEGIEPISSSEKTSIMKLRKGRKKKRREKETGWLKTKPVRQGHQTSTQSPRAFSSRTAMKAKNTETKGVAATAGSTGRSETALQKRVTSAGAKERKDNKKPKPKEKQKKDKNKTPKKKKPIEARG